MIAVYSAEIKIVIFQSVSEHQRDVEMRANLGNNLIFKQCKLQA